jgi:hypothetical protein
MRRFKKLALKPHLQRPMVSALCPGEPSFSHCPKNGKSVAQLSRNRSSGAKVKMMTACHIHMGQGIGPKGGVSRSWLQVICRTGFIRKRQETFVERL